MLTLLRNCVMALVGLVVLMCTITDDMSKLTSDFHGKEFGRNARYVCQFAVLCGCHA